MAVRNPPGREGGEPRQLGAQTGRPLQGRAHTDTCKAHPCIRGRRSCHCYRPHERGRPGRCRCSLRERDPGNASPLRRPRGHSPLAHASVCRPAPGTRLRGRQSTYGRRGDARGKPIQNAGIPQFRSTRGAGPRPAGCRRDQRAESSVQLPKSAKNTCSSGTPAALSILRQASSIPRDAQSCFRFCTENQQNGFRPRHGPGTHTRHASGRQSRRAVFRRAAAEAGGASRTPCPSARLEHPVPR